MKQTYIPHDAIFFNFSTIIITTKTDVFATSSEAVTVVDNIQEKINKLTGSKNMDIIDACTSPKKTRCSVEGKVVLVSKQIYRTTHCTETPILHVTMPDFAYFGIFNENKHKFCQLQTLFKVRKKNR